MILEFFQLVEDTSIDTSSNKRDFMKKYHQQGAQLIDSIQGIDFLFFGENNTYHQIGNGYLESDITLRKNSGSFKNTDADGNIVEPIRLVGNAFADAFSMVTLFTTGGDEIE